MYATRFIADTGIGGEYAAINSAIDEMMPSRYRGRVDIWINGTYWAGSILGTFATFLLLNSLPAISIWRGLNRCYFSSLSRTDRLVSFMQLRSVRTTLLER
jgi:MFS family permease